MFLKVLLSTFCTLLCSSIAVSYGLISMLQEPPIEFTEVVLNRCLGNSLDVGAQYSKFTKTNTYDQLFAWLLYLLRNGLPSSTTNITFINTSITKSKYAILHAIKERVGFDWSTVHSKVSPNMQQTIKQELLIDAIRGDGVNDPDPPFKICLGPLRSDIIHSICKVGQWKEEWKELIEFIENANDYENESAREVAHLLVIKIISEFGESEKIDRSILGAITNKTKSVINTVNNRLLLQDVKFFGSILQVIFGKENQRIGLEKEKKQETCIALLEHVSSLQGRIFNYVNDDDFVDLILTSLETNKKIQNILNIQNIIYKNQKSDKTRLVIPFVELFKPPLIINGDADVYKYKCILDILKLIFPNICKKVASDGFHLLFRYTILESTTTSPIKTGDLLGLVQYIKDDISIYLAHFIKHFYKTVDTDDERGIILLKKIIKVVPPSYLYPYLQSLVTKLNLVTNHEKIAISIMPYLVSIQLTKERELERPLKVIREESSNGKRIFKIFFKKILEQVENFDQDVPHIDEMINIVSSLDHLVHSLNMSSKQINYCFQQLIGQFGRLMSTLSRSPMFNHSHQLSHQQMDEYGEYEEEDIEGNNLYTLKRIQLLGVQSCISQFLTNLLEYTRDEFVLSNHNDAIQSWILETKKIAKGEKSIFQYPILLVLKNQHPNIIELGSAVELDFIVNLLNGLNQNIESIVAEHKNSIVKSVKTITRFIETYYSFNNNYNIIKYTYSINQKII
ncbi:hypothetical protein DFA_10281 [Cavenderia fasciculata]|uniref:Uncharacterized protein n=1 Tax=Cavenderia fasciculata TaxID=261658 RepID=F4Q9S5_CACFS|nr:uncharacterized protein DFA_10281 [Cavenderia fasciculata]EGG15444.1 hypothetical protein DFA_10281 [Cavenderia fasciculata]|eukprot:XP_004354186.1 hypothetical protein DFA_10281 [Cavenderia fasciculata]